MQTTKTNQTLSNKITLTHDNPEIIVKNGFSFPVLFLGFIGADPSWFLYKGSIKLFLVFFTSRIIFFLLIATLLGEDFIIRSPLEFFAIYFAYSVIPAAFANELIVRHFKNKGWREKH